MKTPLERILVPAALCLLAARASAAEIVVAAGGGGDFTAIQPAVDAAAPDDLILVLPGTYPGSVQIDGKPLWIVVDGPEESVVVEGTLRVENLASDAIVVLIGLVVRGPDGTDHVPGSPGLDLADNQGEVRVHGSRFTGGIGAWDGREFEGWLPGPGGRASACARVTLSGCNFTGGRGVGNPGADGFVETTSAVAAWSSTFTGGRGSDNASTLSVPTPGGPGFRATSYGVFAAGCTFEGGRGGTENDLCFYTSADGGPGLFLPPSGTQARFMESSATGGPGGAALCSSAGNPGPAVAGGGTPIQVSGAARWLEGEAVVSVGVPTPFTVHGAPGDTVYLRQDDEPRYLYRPWYKGFDLVDARWMPIEPFVVPGSGTLVTTRADHAWAGGERTRLFGQAYVVTATGAIVLGGPLSLVVGP